jgi:hypothetical protein
MMCSGSLVFLSLREKKNNSGIDVKNIFSATKPRLFIVLTRQNTFGFERDQGHWPCVPLGGSFKVAKLVNSEQLIRFCFVTKVIVLVRLSIPML